MSEPEVGKRFSHVYLPRDEPSRDSSKGRFRIAKLSERMFPKLKSTYGKATINHELRAQNTLEHELGVQFATSGYRYWRPFFEKITLIEMLDSITILTRYLIEWRKGEEVTFIKEARRIIKEENLSYELDSLGGVHPLIDSTFSASKQSAIKALNGDRYAATVEGVDRMDACLLQNPPDYIGAIRCVFGSCENLFKLMYAVPRLDAGKVGEKLGRDQQALYAGNTTLQAASAKTLEGFKAWVNAAHFYRHEQGVEELSQPPEELAILLISQGLSHVRWLAQMDQTRTA